MANRREIAVILLMVLLLAGVWLVVSRLSNTQSSAQTQFVEDAVRNAALTCYAVEGMYPEDLTYLREHYNLSYNEERYHVFYEPIASNLMPSIKVAERGGKMDK